MHTDKDDREQKSPIERNQIFTAEITGMTHEGMGVARVEGFVVFIKDAIVGETVETKIIKVNKSYAVGKLLKVIKESDNRCDPFCSVFNRCGGCTLQHMSYTGQLKFKEGLVRDALERVGGLGKTVIHPIIGMDNPYTYRNKAQYPVQMVEGKIQIGFFTRRSHSIVDAHDCGIQDSTAEKVKEIIRKFLEDYSIPIYDPETGKGLVRHIVIRKGFSTGEVMVVLVVNGADIPKKELLGEELKREVPGTKSIVLNVNREKTNVIMGKRNITIYGQDYITDYIGNLRFNISPNSFFQVNPVQTEVLYKKALEFAGGFAGLLGSKTVFDIYCGVGTISLFLAQAAKHVYGIESVTEAIDDARKNAAINNVGNVTFIAGQAEEAVPKLYANGIRADVVVVDPPRKGCDEAVLITIIEMKPERIVYVSCNPATLARDMKYLCENGYRTVEVQPVDMFPWSEHVEAVTRLVKE